MKKINLSVIACSLAVLFLSSCGGGSVKIVKNEFLGEVPSLEKGYYDKMQEKEKAIKECTDIKKSFKLSKEKDLLKDEWGAKIKESLTTNPLTKALPVESLAGVDYTINEIKIDKDIKNEYGNFEKDLLVYFKALDKDGKDIEGSTTVAVVYKREEMKAGKTVEASGTWQTKGLKNMENFAKIKIITKDEYDKKK
ncbi:MAG: hypothetical protein H3C64_10835 [Candidatus Kuenenia stuttgartiensis]|nr:hypothetical protein [Candidatus Kuenenia stuttgartiensis]